jgi:hypothetical protein
MVAIRKIDWNGEIWRKILNSVAGKYNCGVNFTLSRGRLNFEGDVHCAEEIVKEVMGLFSSSGYCRSEPV